MLIPAHFGKTNLVSINRATISSAIILCHQINTNLSAQNLDYDYVILSSIHRFGVKLHAITVISMVAVAFWLVSGYLVSFFCLTEFFSDFYLMLNWVIEWHYSAFYCVYLL